MICLCLFSGWATSQASTLVCQIAIFVAGFSPDYVANYSLIVSLSCQNKTNGVSCLQVASRIDIYLSINLSTQLNFTYVYIYICIYHYLSLSIMFCRYLSWPIIIYFYSSQCVVCFHHYIPDNLSWCIIVDLSIISSHLIWPWSFLINLIYPNLI